MTDKNDSFYIPEDGEPMGEPTDLSAAAPEKAAAGSGKKTKKQKKAKKPKKAAKPEAEAEAEAELPSLDDEAAAEPDKGKKPGKKAKKDRHAGESKGRRVLRKIKITLIIIVCVLSLLAAGAAAGGYYVTNNGVTLPNLYIGKVFVGNMTRDEVDAALEESGWDELTAEKLKVTLPANVSFTVSYEESGARITREEAVDLACAYGHDGNWFSNLFLYLTNYLSAAEADPEVTLDGEYIKGEISKAEEKFEKATEDEGYTIDEENEKLVLVKGAGQMKLDEDGLYTEIEAALLAGSTKLSYSSYATEPAMPDFQALHDKLAVDPSDAYFTEDFEVVDEVDGVWFEVSEAEKLWSAAEPLEKVEIPMTLTFPEVKGDDLRAMLYRDKLGAQTTYYTSSNDNRISNINKVAEMLNGLIMMPGEEFSYNDYVGQRTEERGFLPAGAYENGQVVEEVGGGICQVSSTLYTATLYAQLETVSRTSHYFQVTYLPLGQDATVSWPKPDFKFKNSRDYPIKIVAYCDNDEKSLTIEIWGTDVDGSYVTLRHETYTRYDETYTDVAIGYLVYGFVTRYDSEGNLIEDKQVSISDYYFHDEDINWPEEKLAADAAAAESGGTA